MSIRLAGKDAVTSNVNWPDRCLSRLRWTWFQRSRIQSTPAAGIRATFCDCADSISSFPFRARRRVTWSSNYGDCQLSQPMQHSCLQLGSMALQDDNNGAHCAAGALIDRALFARLLHYRAHAASLVAAPFGAGSTQQLLPVRPSAVRTVVAWMQWRWSYSPISWVVFVVMAFYDCLLMLTLALCVYDTHTRC